MQTQEKRLTVVLPQDCAVEVIELAPIGKAMLMCELVDEVIEKIDGFPALDLSASTTQWLKSLTTREALQVIENLALQLMGDIQK